MTPFINKFGAYNAAKQAYYLPNRTASLMNSLPLLGKLLGTVIVGPIIEKIGHRQAMRITCFVQVIGAISEWSRSCSVEAKGTLTYGSTSYEQQCCSIRNRSNFSICSRWSR